MTEAEFREWAAGVVAAMNRAVAVIEDVCAWQAARVEEAREAEAFAQSMPICANGEN